MALVAPEMFENEEPFVELCHWYESVPEDTVAVTLNDAVPDTYTDLLDGCVVNVGTGVALTTTEAELEFVDLDTPLFVAVATHL